LKQESRKKERKGKRMIYKIVTKRTTYVTAEFYEEAMEKYEEDDYLKQDEETLSVTESNIEEAFSM
jgi:hypothetical protein